MKPFILALATSFIVCTQSASAASIQLRGTFNDRGTKLGIATLVTDDADCKVTLFGSLVRHDVDTQSTEALLIAGTESRLFSIERLKVFSTKAPQRRLFLRAVAQCTNDTTDTGTVSVRLVKNTFGSATKKSFTERLKKNLTPQTLSLSDAFPGLTFSDPVGFTIEPGTQKIYIVGQNGTISRVTNGQKETFFDISDLIEAGGERGLLGFAFHPEFRKNHFIYVHYSAKGTGDTVIARYKVQGGTVDTTSALILFTTSQPFSNHNGGQIEFGRDGLLYIALGDGGNGGDPLGNGQNRSTFLGKILRIDVDRKQGDKNYGIPASNPFRGNSSGFKEEIYAYGLRNPWRFSFDSKTGKLWAADVGQGSYEEIDIIKRGANYGWNTMEGFHCFSPSTGCDQNGLTLPVTEYDHSNDNVSVTGGYVYRAFKNMPLHGLYIFGDFGSGRVFALDSNNPTSSPAQILDSDKLISSFGVDAKGELYLLSYGNGKVYKLGL